MKRVLIIGGYGNFGSFISQRLANQPQINLVIAGRSIDKAKQLANDLGVEAVDIDIYKNLEARLEKIKPDIVVHTSGPFQSQSYKVAEACIDIGAHYIDLADGREFVSGITHLQKKAEQANVLVVSGASSVPCLSAALVDDYKPKFKSLTHLDYGITTAQKTTRGLATTVAILSYTGKPFKAVINGEEKDVYGWQSLRARKYKGLGWRLLGNCNIPDLELFPKIYPEIKTLRFYAGLELPFIHITLWLLSWLTRFRLIKSLAPLAPLLLKTSFLFDRLGTKNSGFHMSLSGRDKNDKEKIICFELTAKKGDGPLIPCMPAIILTKKLANENIDTRGAMPCIGMISKDEYLDSLKGLAIHWSENIV